MDKEPKTITEQFPPENQLQYFSNIKKTMTRNNKSKEPPFAHQSNRKTRHPQLPSDPEL